MRGPIAILLAAIVMLLAAPPPASSAQPLITGISAQPSEQTGEPLRYERIRGAGARFVRITVHWSGIAPDSEPLLWNPSDPGDLHYRWKSADEEISQAVRVGLEPLIQIYTAPRWAQRCQRDFDPTAPCDPDPADVADFARAIAGRYSGSFLDQPRGRYWQLFNEPNLDFYFNPQLRDGKPVSPILYRTLINVFARAVKSVRPSNIVVGPGLAPLGNEGNVAPLAFMRRLLCMKGRARPRRANGCNKTTSFDVWATNPYTTGGPTHEAAGRDEVSLGDLPEMRRLLRAAERAGRIESDLSPIPFWVTEFSWDSKPPDPGGLSWRVHARWAAEAIYRAWTAGVSTFFWFGLRDPADAADPLQGVVESGLYLRGETLAQDKPKRVLGAFRFPFVAFRGERGVRVWGRTPTSDAGQVRIEVRREGRWQAVASLRADRRGIFRRLIRTSYGRRERGLVRARYRSQGAVPFSLNYVGDFYAPPFGLSPGQAHTPQRQAIVGRTEASGTRPRRAE